MKKTAVLFDFDGTLFYGTTDINYYAMNLALADMGRPPISRELANTTVGDKIPDACRRILGTRRSSRTVSKCSAPCPPLRPSRSVPTPSAAT